MPTSSQHPETIALHAGYRSDPTTNAVAVPIYQTTSYQFNSTEHAGNLFALKEFGNIYTRIMNPTQAVLEERVAALEGGVAALALPRARRLRSSPCRTSATPATIFVSSTDIYGGTWNFFQNTMSTMGIECRFVDPADPQSFARATDARTKCYYGETLPNPKLTVFPDRRGRQNRARSGRAAHHGQHRLPGAVPAAEAWRGDHRALDHEIYRRPRQFDRRHSGGWRQFRLGEACRAASPCSTRPIRAITAQCGRRR